MCWKSPERACGCDQPGHKVNDASSRKLRISLTIFGWLCSKVDMGLQFPNKWMNLADF